MLLQRGERLLHDRQFHLSVGQRYAFTMERDLDVAYVTAALDNPLRNRKTDGERFEFARRAHHDGVRDTVED